MKLQSIINKKGIEIKLGDVVVAKGSKIERIVRQIKSPFGKPDKIEINAIRVDGLDKVWSKWLDADEIKIIKNK